MTSAGMFRSGKGTEVYLSQAEQIATFPIGNRRINCQVATQLWAIQAAASGMSCAWFTDVGEKAEELKERTARFAHDVVCLIRQLPTTVESRKIGTQLLSSATSVAANYRAACKARSHSEFLAKLGVVVEEADESQFWLGFLVRTEIVEEGAVAKLRIEAAQLTAIFSASHKTASLRRNRR